MKKHLLFLNLLLVGSNLQAIPVYDAANHQTNMQIYQTNILQKIEQVRTATEAVQHTVQQAQNLKDNATNLETWTGMFLGEQSAEILKGIDDLNAINNNSKNIIRDVKNLEKDFNNLYLEKEKIKNLTYDDIYNSMNRVASNRRTTNMENLKTATTVLQQNQKDRQTTSSYMSMTDSSRGALQATLATKKGIDQLNSKITRSLDLQAKTLMAQAQKQEDEEILEELEKEKTARMFQVSEKTKKAVEQMQKNGRLW